MAIIDQKILDKIPSILRNKIVLLLAIYFIYLCFFSQHSIWSQGKLLIELRKLKKEERHYRTSIADIRKEQRTVFSSMDEIERYARENYWMKKDSEDLYIIVEE